MPLDDTNWPPPDVEIDETTALLPPRAASDAATRLLSRARGFVEHGWCRYAIARDAAGEITSATSADAVAWCMGGALFAAGLPRKNYWKRPAYRRLEAAIGGDVGTFNNRQETVEPVLAAFDRAITQEG